MTSVPQSAVTQGPFLWSRGTAARETLRYLDRNGIDAEPLLLKAELSRGQLSPDSGGISVASQHRLLELAAIEMNDSLLGLHVAAEMDLRDAGILFLPCRGFGDGRGSSRIPGNSGVMNASPGPNITAGRINVAEGKASSTAASPLPRLRM